MSAGWPVTHFTLGQKTFRNWISLHSLLSSHKKLYQTKKNPNKIKQKRHHTLQTNSPFIRWMNHRGQLSFSQEDVFLQFLIFFFSIWSLVFFFFLRCHAYMSLFQLSCLKGNYASASVRFLWTSGSQCYGNLLKVSFYVHNVLRHQLWHYKPQEQKTDPALWSPLTMGIRHCRNSSSVWRLLGN